VVGALSFFAYSAWRKRLPQVPVAVVTAHEEATALLRRDDSASREEAIRRLGALVASNPGYVEGRAELAVALALRFDDARVDLQRLQAEQARLREEIRRLEVLKATADWEIRVNALREELVALQKEQAPLEAQVKQLGTEAWEAMAPLAQTPAQEPAPAAAARLRAQAIHAGVTSAPTALAFSERLKVVSPQWAIIAHAEYALNADSPPETLAQVAAGLEGIRDQDRTFLRAYVLGARVAMKMKEPTVAQGLLDTVVALNPNHALAGRLQTWAAEQARQAAAP
jgi:cell division protein FtsB